MLIGCVKPIVFGNGDAKTKRKMIDGLQLVAGVT